MFSEAESLFHIYIASSDTMLVRYCIASGKFLISFAIKNLVSVPDPKPTPVRIAFSRMCGDTGSDIRAG